MDKLEGVTLDRLYRSRKTVTMPDGEEVVVRALSDAERGQIEMDALAAAMRFDRNVKDENSDEYMCYLYPLREALPEVLLNVLIQWRTSEAEGEAYKSIPDEYVPYPDDASLEDKKAIEEKRKEVEADVKARREKFVKEAADRAKEKFEKLSEPALQMEAISRRMQYLSASEAWSERVSRAILYTVEKKDGTRRFASIEEVESLDTAVISFLYSQHKEVDGLDPWAIVKFRAGRQSDGVVVAEKGARKSRKANSVVVGVHREPSETGGQQSGIGIPASRP